MDAGAGGDGACLRSAAGWEAGWLGEVFVSREVKTEVKYRSKCGSVIWMLTGQKRLSVQEPKQNTEEGNLVFLQQAS